MTDQAPQPAPAPVPAPAIVIAAGGDGARLGGGKPARLLGGQRLIDYAVAWALRHSDAVALAVRPGDGDHATGLPLLVDGQSGIGPISALSSAFDFAAQRGRATVLLIACDMPFLPDDLIEQLTPALIHHRAALPIYAGRLHPMAALWRVERDALNRFMAGGGQSLWRMAQSVGMAEVEWADAADPFANINDAEALAAAETRLKTPTR